MDPIMLNQLSSDLCRILKINYARFDNDASACFDRIIVALGMLAARRCGMPKEAVSTHAKSLELMKYTVKTVHGISDSSYTGTAFAPLFGTGQGSGASPAVWLSLVVLLLNTLKRVVPQRMSFMSPDGVNVRSSLVDAFVDDTALGYTDEGDLSMEEMTTQLETMAQTWEQLLHFSGGALNLGKCSWYMMYWDWRCGRPVLRKQLPTDPSVVRRRGESDIVTEIPRQHEGAASRILGVYQNPTGDFSTQLIVMKKKADKFAGLLLSPRMTTTDIRLFHKTMYAPAMRYALPAIAVDEEEYEQVQNRIIPVIVQRLGFIVIFPRQYGLGPVELGGLGLYNLRTERESK